MTAMYSGSVFRFRECAKELRLALDQSGWAVLTLALPASGRRPQKGRASSPSESDRFNAKVAEESSYPDLIPTPCGADCRCRIGRAVTTQETARTGMESIEDWRIAATPPAPTGCPKCGGPMMDYQSAPGVLYCQGACNQGAAKEGNCDTKEGK